MTRLVSMLLVVTLFSFTIFDSRVALAENNLEQAIVVEQPSSDQTNNEIERPITPHQLAREQIKQVMASDAFHHQTTEEVAVYDGKAEKSFSSDYNGAFDFWYFFGKVISVLVEFALWIFVALLIIFLVLKYGKLLSGFDTPKFEKKSKPKKLFGLDMQAASLPEQPWLVALELVNQNNYRSALSLLYRASLIWFIENTQVVIREGDTELECLGKIIKHSQQLQSNFMHELTELWRYLAYAHISPDKNKLANLCQQWPEIMLSQANQSVLLEEKRR